LLQAGCHSCLGANSVKKAKVIIVNIVVVFVVISDNQNYVIVDFEMAVAILATLEIS